jgi:hypothetical protein
MDTCQEEVRLSYGPYTIVITCGRPRGHGGWCEPHYERQDVSDV